MATVKVRNVGPFDRDIKSIGAIVPVGEVVEVGEALGKSLAEQVDVWQIVTDKASAAKADEKVEG